MMNNVKHRPIYFVILVCFVLLFAACSSEMQSAPQEAQVIVKSRWPFDRSEGQMRFESRHNAWLPVEGVQM